MKRSIVLALAALVGACAPAVPDTPTYEEDVRPILAANCERCHGAPAADQQEPRFCLRADVWASAADTATPAVDGKLGACPNDLADPTGALANLVYGVQADAEAIVDKSLSGEMPKDGPALTDRQLEILRLWRDAGYPQRGAGTNHPPEIQFVTPPAGDTVVDASYDVQYDVSDPDGDAVTWSLTWDGGGRTGTFAAWLGGGAGTLTVDTSVLASGTYTLTAHLDDGIDVADVDAPGTLTVPPGRNAAPTVVVVAPNGGESFYNDQPVDVVFTVDDPDAAALTCDVVALHGATPISIASNLPAVPGQQLTVPWTVGSAPIAADYTIRVTVTDDATPTPAQAQDTSDAPFAITAPPQNVPFSTVQGIFTGSCVSSMCHDNTNPQEGMKLTAGNAYGAIVGVASNQCGPTLRVAPGDPDHSYLLWKVNGGGGTCFTGSQMPKSPTPLLTTTQRQQLRDWIANGAPP